MHTYVMWCGVFRLFGFPNHYTDVANIPVTRRHKVLGQSWSVPVIKHLLLPLRAYFSIVGQSSGTTKRLSEEEAVDERMGDSDCNVEGNSEGCRVIGEVTYSQQ